MEGLVTSLLSKTFSIDFKQYTLRKVTTFRKLSLSSSGVFMSACFNSTDLAKLRCQRFVRNVDEDRTQGVQSVCQTVSNTHTHTHTGGTSWNEHARHSALQHKSSDATGNANIGACVWEGQ